MENTQDKINAELAKDFSNTDRNMFYLLIVQWFIATLLTSQFHGTYYFGFINGGFLVLIGWIALKFFHGTIFSRSMFGVLFMGMSTIYIQQSLGLIEMHFFLFVFIAILTLYKDQWAVTSASIFISNHKIPFGRKLRHHLLVMNNRTRYKLREKSYK